MQLRKIKYFLFVLGFLLFRSLYGQELISRFDPSLYNSFLAGQQLPDHTYRIFSGSQDSRYWAYSHLFVSDWKVDSMSRETWLPSDSSGYPVLFGAYNLFLLALPNSDAILVSNHFECDFGGTEVAYLTADRQLKWLLPANEIDPYPYEIRETGLVNDGVLALLSNDMDPLYISFNGTQVFYEFPPPVYTHILYHHDFIYGYQDHHWVQLDTSFEEIRTLAVDTVTAAFSIGSAILLETNEGVLLIDSALNVLGENETLHHIRSATILGKYFGVINERHLFVLDSTLQIIREEEAQPEEELNYITSNQDTAFVWSTYLGIYYSDFIIRRFRFDQPPYIPAIDLELLEVILPDTVFVNAPVWPFYLQFVFDSVSFEVKNHSMDTVDQLRIEFDWSSFGLQCVTYQGQWELDGVHLLPGENRIIRLDPFVTDTIPYGFHSPFCFWIESPNDQPDPDPSNNYACGSTQLAAVTNELTVNDLVHISPNPAEDGVYIEVDESMVGKMDFTLVSLDGKTVYKGRMNSDSEFFSVADFAPGLYLVQFTLDIGGSLTRKLMIQH